MGSVGSPPGLFYSEIWYKTIYPVKLAIILKNKIDFFNFGRGDWSDAPEAEIKKLKEFGGVLEVWEDLTPLCLPWEGRGDGVSLDLEVREELEAEKPSKVVDVNLGLFWNVESEKDQGQNSKA